MYFILAFEGADVVNNVSHDRKFGRRGQIMSKASLHHENEAGCIS